MKKILIEIESTDDIADEEQFIARALSGAEPEKFKTFIVTPEPVKKG